uniref:Uncharacterized protein n=1 Tax=Fagus sylvatica TaxID=28930 RepID=A0A2N9IGN6_FAGSY
MASSKTRDSHVQESSNEYGDIHEMLHDLFPMQNTTSRPVEEGPSVRQHAQGPNEDAQRFYNLLKDAEQSLYEGCKNFSKLSAIVHLCHLKCISGWTNKSFTMLLQLLQDLLPLDAKLPKNCYEAKKITNKLGLGYKNIHACPNDCMLFWKEKVLDESCSECGASRWAESKSDLSEDHFDADDDDDDEMEHNMNDSSKKRKKKAAKILRWFPLKPRLQRLFMSSKTATHMKWHADGRTDDGLMRHPADSPAWKTFDSKYAVMWTINDFPTYGDLSGWNTKGALTCPFCNYDTHSCWLNNGGKYCFMGHRRFLDNDHKFRKDTVSFDESREMRPAPVIPSGQDIIMQTEQEYHMLRHNLDVMHVEKNVTDNIMGTLLNVAKKTKDNLKARFDLQDMGIRSELHPEECGNDKWSMPHACFTMTTSEKYSFLEVLEGVRVPDGYASNVSRCVKLKERKIIGLITLSVHPC